jgi:hypothetical protein
VVDLAIEQPARGQLRVSEALKRQGLSISPAGLRCVWQRHDLTSIKHRLKALEGWHPVDRGADRRPRKGPADKKPHGEFESECPGYCGAQDTFYVGTLKGVGRVHQQTVIDTHAKVAFAKLYDRKTPITAAEILNDRVVPFYDEHGIRLSRMLTDRGTEFCGTQSHEYEPTSRSRTSITAAPRPRARKPTAPASASTAPCWMSSTGWRSAKRSIAPSMSCGPTLMRGSSNTTSNDPIGPLVLRQDPMQTFLDALPLAKEKLMAA